MVQVGGKQKVVGIGAGGHARVVIDAILQRGDVEIIGLLDPQPHLHGRTVSGISVLGGDNLLPLLRERGVSACFIGVGGKGDNRPRRAVFERVVGLGFEVIAIVHPRATVAGSARLGQGTVVMAGAVINPWAEIGSNVIVNTGAIVEHDCRVEDHVHVAPGAVIGGHAWVGEGAHLGLRCAVLQGCRVGRWTLVGAGAVVHRDLPDGVKAVGVPARILGRVEGV